MTGLKRINGIDTLMNKLPREYHYWYKFGNILKLNYEKTFDYEDKFDDIYVIEMLLTDIQNKYTIKMILKDVIGEISFDMVNGFYSGLTIDDFKESGYSDHCFRISSFEPDISFEIYCEKIYVELMEGESI